MLKHNYNIYSKRAAVAVYREIERIQSSDPPELIDRVSLASIAAGGASRRSIFMWLNEDLSDEAQITKFDNNGRPPHLSEDQKSLLIGFATKRRLDKEIVPLEILKNFCESHLCKELSYSTISNLMNEYGFSCQRVMTRNTRMISEEVVDAAITFIHDIRSYGFPPSRIISMDETGLWSNVTKPTTYHFKNWCDLLYFLNFIVFSKVYNFPMMSSFAISLISHHLPTVTLPLHPINVM